MGFGTDFIDLDKLTTTEMNAMVSPPESCIIWNTTLKKLCVYNGTGWEQVTSTLIV